MLSTYLRLPLISKFQRKLSKFPSKKNSQNGNVPFPSGNFVPLSVTPNFLDFCSFGVWIGLLENYTVELDSPRGLARKVLQEDYKERPFYRTDILSPNFEGQGPYPKKEWHSRERFSHSCGFYSIEMSLFNCDTGGRHLLSVWELPSFLCSSCTSSNRLTMPSNNG